MRRYAAGTSVPVDRSRAEVEKILQGHGLTHVGVFTAPDHVVVCFTYRAGKPEARNVLMRLSLPGPDWTPRAGRQRTRGATAEQRAQEIRRRWRALVLSLKAKLESAATNIETFEQAFLAHIVVPGEGTTVGAQVAGALSEAYKTGRAMPLLPFAAGSEGRG